MKFSDIKQMELNLLEAIYLYGEFSFIWNGDNEKPLSVKYIFDECGYTDDDSNHLTAVIRYLIEKQYLMPRFITRKQRGNEIIAEKFYDKDVVEGITPKGYSRLLELKHPVRTWVHNNWFPAIVALTTILVGLPTFLIGIYNVIERLT